LKKFDELTDKELETKIAAVPDFHQGPSRRIARVVIEEEELTSFIAVYHDTAHANLSTFGTMLSQRSRHVYSSLVLAFHHVLWRL
jgi:hypothetical protein